MGPYRCTILRIFMILGFWGVTPAQAQPMQTLEILTPAQEAALTAPHDQTTQPHDTAPAPTSPTLAIPASSPLIPEKELQPWTGAAAMYTAQGNPERLKAVIQSYKMTQGTLPPEGLLQLAVLIAETGDLKNAAPLYYGAQLRARFDFARWPVTGPQNPHRAFTESLKTTGKDIAIWAASSATRLSDVMEAVRVWDLATPYQYAPVYARPGRPPAPDEKTWPDLLTQTRTAFFADAATLIQALQTLGR